MNLLPSALPWRGLLFFPALLVFISGSAMLIGMRAKEIIAITPIYFFLVSLGLPNAWTSNKPYLVSKALKNRLGHRL